MIQEDLLKRVKVTAQSWLSDSYDEETRDRVKYLLEKDEKELVDSFYTHLEFGTGGLRGVMGVGTNRMNIYTVSMATQGLCNYLLKEFQNLPRIKVAIAHDSRNNSRLFAEKAAEIFSANGMKVYLFDGLRPTPELSFAIRHLGCQSGIVITASHNPKEYNGYKTYWDDGGQIISPHDKNIIEEVSRISSIEEVKTNKNGQLIEPIGEEIDNIYLKKLTSLSLNPEIIQKADDLRIVYTPIHGTGYEMVPRALTAFGFKNIISVPEQNTPDGNFPTVISPNPEESSALELALKKAKKENASIVMATDPDADRVGIAVNRGDGEFILLNGNETAAIFMYYLLSQWKEKGKLTGKEYIVKTIVTSDILQNIGDAFGVKTYEVLTGFKYIAEIILRKENDMTFIAGAEESYGYLAGNFVRDKDAVMSCALIAEAAAWAKQQHKTLLDILKDIHLTYGFFTEKLVNIVKKGKDGGMEIRQMMEKIRNNPPESINGSKILLIHDYQKQKSYDQISHLTYDITLPKSNVLQFILADNTKISMRPSGTEPKIKFYFSVKENISDPQKYDETKEILNSKIEAMVDAFHSF